MHNVIQEFLSERKADRIKKKINDDITESETLALQQQADEMFLLENWLPDAAKRASQLSLVSHSGKFSHPSAKTSAVIAENKKINDGYLRTGNATFGLDVYGNAAAMDVFKFLSLRLSDGRTILEHLEASSEEIKAELKISSATFESLRDGFLSIKKTDAKPMTSDVVKQVYFPVEDGYHLLSILTPSPLVFELKNRIQKMRFSEQVKIARENKKKSVYNELGYDDLYPLSMIGFGGTKPQNISVLNSANGGKAYLLPSMPPTLIKPKQLLPKIDFFINTLWHKDIKDDFSKLHRLFKATLKNKNIRDNRDDYIQSIVNYVIEKMWLVRQQDYNWTCAKRFERLPAYQKIWLDEGRKEEREHDDGWLHRVIKECAFWIIESYEKIYRDKAVILDKEVLNRITDIVTQNEDLLR